MDAADVLEILDRLDAAGVEWWINGGWGVDALLGRETRRHNDLDFATPAEAIERLSAVFPEFRHVDQEEWPSAYVLRDSQGRELDFHPLRFDAEGNGWQPQIGAAEALWPREALEGRGRIGGREVRCMSAEFEVQSHLYAGHDDVDWADVAALCQRFEFPLPAGGPPGFVHVRRGSVLR
jgi:lincosamide nucleotidyltransferase A/C/D/E